MPPDPFALVRSKRYVALLVVAAVLGVPISIAAYYFLWLVTRLETWTFTNLPTAIGFHGEPIWWPVLPLALAGLLVGLIIRYLPGTGGRSPVDGFQAGETPVPIELPGIVLAALASLGLGAVIGPEGPLIALGAGLGVVAVRLAKRDAPAQTVTLVAAAASFAAVSALLGSPLLGAFLLMEVSGLGGPMATTVLLPGLLAAGVGSLIFLGLDSLTGLGTFSLTLPPLPHFARPTGVEFLWALGIGAGAALLGLVLRRLALALRPIVTRRMVLLTPFVGLAIAGLAILYGEATGKATSDVLFSGQTGLNSLIAHSASYSVGALLVLILCKGLAYSGSLSSFRGGPTFPAMFLGAAGGLALSHIPGLAMVPAVAMGIGAMTVVMLQLPLTSVLLATLLLGSNGLTTMPVVIVAVVVAFVTSKWLLPRPPADPEAPDPPVSAEPNAATPTPAP